MASHGRSDSNSFLSSPTSISSRSSVETYESFKDEITSVKQSKIDLQELVNKAEKIINDELTPSPLSTYTYGGVSVNLDAVMSAMLVHAEECGAESGKRYVASAIVACSLKEEIGSVAEALAALSVAWLTHFLFIFQTSKSHRAQSDDEPDELATSTYQKTFSHVGEGVASRNASFRDDVMIRDGYTCVITKAEDFSHRRPSPDALITSQLEAAHILRRVIGKFDKDPKSDSFKSVAATFDILVNYTCLPITAIEDLKAYLDDSSNGMLLQADTHTNFDQFYWCLKQTDTDNQYTLKLFKNFCFPGVYENKLITFADCSGMVNADSTSNKRNCAMPLPNPHNIAIHAAIAGILNMSGAGKFFDELLDKCKDDEGMVPPVESWEDLEKALKTSVLNDSLHFLNVH